MPINTTSEGGRVGAQTTLDLFDLLWRRRWYVVACVSIGIMLGVAYCFTATPMYESTADVLVIQKRPQPVTGDHQYESGFEDYLATHLAIIVSPVIVERAIESSDLASLESFADLEYPEEDLADTIIENLFVEGGSRDLGENADSIMTVSYLSTVPEDAPVVVQAILDSYESFHHEVYRGMSDSTVELIGEASELLENDLAQQEESYSNFRQASPLVSSGTEEVNPLQNRLAAIELRRSELLLRRAEVESQLLALEKIKGSGADKQQMLVSVAAMRQQTDTENSLPNVSTALETQLVQLMDNELELLEHYGPNHPHVLTMRQRIDEARQLFALPTTAHQTDADPSDSTAADRDPVEVYTEYLQQELNSLNIAEDLLSDLYDREHNLAKEYSIYQLRDSGFRRGIERTEALYDVVISRLQEASLVKDYGGFETSVIAPPSLGMKVSPRRRIALPLAAFAGLLLGSMIAVLVDVKDDSFYSCDQVQQQLRLPVIGRIPQFSNNKLDYEESGGGDRIHPNVWAFHRPHTMAAEAIRSLRTSLYFNGGRETSRVVQVTGVDAGDGASTVAANLAVSLAQTGKRVLLIDADLSSQRQQELFGMDQPESGLASVVLSDVEPMDAIRQTPVDNLWLLSSGMIPNGPCEIFTSPRFRELINLVRDSYDHVLIDTETMLSSSDPFVIASNTDGVIVTLRLAHDSRATAMQAKQMMDRVDVEVLGVVVNRMSDANPGQPARDRQLVSHRLLDASGVSASASKS